MEFGEREGGMGAPADMGRFSADLISHSVQELSITYKKGMFWAK